MHSITGHDYAVMQCAAYLCIKKNHASCRTRPTQTNPNILRHVSCITAGMHCQSRGRQQAIAKLSCSLALVMAYSARLRNEKLNVAVAANSRQSLATNQYTGQ